MQKSAKKPDLKEQIKEKTRMITNIKAAIFDMIEDKSKRYADIEIEKQAISGIEKEIVKTQTALEGERKVLKDLEQGIVTVEK